MGIWKDNGTDLIVGVTHFAFQHARSRLDRSAHIAGVGVKLAYSVKRLPSLEDQMAW